MCIKHFDEMEAFVPVHKWKGRRMLFECILHVTEKCDDQRTLKQRASQMEEGDGLNLPPLEC